MKECEKQFNKIIQNPANFNFDKQSYNEGWQAALKWALEICYDYEERWDHSISDEIREELKNGNS